jgi:hypothetical protein
MNQGSQPPPVVRGWLLVFCLVLLVWEPVSLAVLASSFLGDAMFRGLAFFAVLAARVIIVAVGVGAALAFFNQRPFAAALAKLAVLLSAGMATFLTFTAYFPSNLAPDLKLPALAATLVWYAGWLVYLLRSRRVRAFADLAG